VNPFVKTPPSDVATKESPPLGGGGSQKGFATLAEAKAKARELAAKPMGPYPKTYTVEAVTRSGEGGALFTASQEILGTTATVEVKYVKGRKEAPEMNAWLFFGWASS